MKEKEERKKGRGLYSIFRAGDPSVLDPPSPFTRPHLRSDRTGLPTDVLAEHCMIRQRKMPPRSREGRDSNGGCALVEILQHTCPFEQVDGVGRYVCYPIPRIFRVYVDFICSLRLSTSFPVNSRCKDKPAVELTKFVRIDMNTGQVELPRG